MSHDEAQKIIGVTIYRTIISARQMASAQDTYCADCAKKYAAYAEANKGGGHEYFLRLAEAYAVLADQKPYDLSCRQK